MAALVSSPTSATPSISLPGVELSTVWLLLDILYTGSCSVQSRR